MSDEAKKAGADWALKQKGMPLYFTGDMVEWRHGEQRMNVAEFSMDRAKAQRCSDRAAAEAVAFIFGITGIVEPVQLDARE